MRFITKFSIKLGRYFYWFRATIFFCFTKLFFAIKSGNTYTRFCFSEYLKGRRRKSKFRVYDGTNRKFVFDFLCLTCEISRACKTHFLLLVYILYILQNPRVPTVFVCIPNTIKLEFGLNYVTLF